MDSVGSIKSRGMNRCAAAKCRNNSNNCKFSFFKFPTDIGRARHWAIACNREDLVGKDNLHDLSYRLCGLHFENRMFANELHNRLRKDALPSIFPDMEGTSSGSTKEFAMQATEVDQGEECRRKWRYMRDHYMRERSKERTRNWIYHKPLSFLAFLKQERNGGTLLQTNKCTTERDVDEDDEDDVFSESENNDKTESSSCNEIPSLPVTDSIVENNSESDDIDTFLKNIGTRLKKLPARSIILMKMNILAQITELELENSWTPSEDLNA